MKTTEILKELERMQNLVNILNLEFNSIKKQIEDSIKPKSGWKKDKSVPLWLSYVDYENEIQYGFDFKGNYFEKKHFDEDMLNNNYDATPQEVEEALKKEAVKKYPIGTKIEGGFNGNGNEKQVIRFHTFRFDSILNKLYILGSGNTGCALVIFSNGIWATPISDPKTLEEYAEEFRNLTNMSVQNSAKDFIQFITKHNFKLPD